MITYSINFIITYSILQYLARCDVRFPIHDNETGTIFFIALTWPLGIWFIALYIISELFGWAANEIYKKLRKIK